ncbi:hypothetical protein SMAC4_13097 [Sordaria macrospora]|uniref:uncharacterized protein n=1 Tax=Sordaria macrospora TaxID=5147 RepID=UPI002B29F36D|nr:hypothetical protein SMAC4_13097 [Sordaria macrospora]
MFRNYRHNNPNPIPQRIEAPRVRGGPRRRRKTRGRVRRLWLRNLPRTDRTRPRMRSARTSGSFRCGGRRRAAWSQGRCGALPGGTGPTTHYDMP